MATVTIKEHQQDMGGDSLFAVITQASIVMRCEGGQVTMSDDDKKRIGEVQKQGKFSGFWAACPICRTKLDASFFQI